MYLPACQCYHLLIKSSNSGTMIFTLKCVGFLPLSGNPPGGAEIFADDASSNAGRKILSEVTPSSRNAKGRSLSIAIYVYNKKTSVQKNP